MKERKLTINIGIISFLVVFIILCLVTFALLSLSSAKANERSTQKSIEHNEIYYSLSSQGEQKLKEIDDQLYQIYQNTSSSEEYFQSMTSLTSLIEDSTLNDHIFSFQLKKDDTLLSVELEILYPGDTFYRIQTWKVSPAGQWNMDQGIDLL